MAPLEFMSEDTSSFSARVVQTIDRVLLQNIGRRIAIVAHQHVCENVPVAIEELRGGKGQAVLNDGRSGRDVAGTRDSGKAGRGLAPLHSLF